jgi:hypothetical protein
LKDGDDDDDNAEARECGRESAGIQGASCETEFLGDRERYFCLRGWQRVSFSLGLMFAGVS